MAATILTGNNNAIRIPDTIMHHEVYAQLFWREAGLMGMDVGNENSLVGNKAYYPIVEKEEFRKNRGKGGDTIRMRLARKLANNPTFEGTDPTGSMEEQSFDYYDALIGVVRHQTVLNEARVSQGRVNFNVLKENMEALGRHGKEQVEDDITRAFLYGYSRSLAQADSVGNTLKTQVKHPNWYYASGEAKGWTADKEATCNNSLYKFGTSVINRMKVIMRAKNFVPASWKGKEDFICVCTEEQLQDLFEDPRWQSNAERAAPRGDDNPLWGGIPAGGRYNGVFIFSYNRLSAFKANLDSVAGGENIHRAIFTGAHAIAFGLDGETKYTTLREDQLQSREGRGYEAVYGASRLDWTTVGNQSSLICSTNTNTVI